MKIKASSYQVVSLHELEPGTAFWWHRTLYMRVKTTNKIKANVVNLYSGELFCWTLDNPQIAQVKIVEDKD